MRLAQVARLSIRKPVSSSIRAHNEYPVLNTIGGLSAAGFGRLHRFELAQIPLAAPVRPGLGEIPPYSVWLAGECIPSLDSPAPR